MSHYHVYLPPTTLFPLGTGTGVDEGTSIPRLQFQELHVPGGVGSQSQFTQSLSQRLDHHRLVKDNNNIIDNTRNIDRDQFQPGPSFSGVITSTSINARRSRKRSSARLSGTADSQATDHGPATPSWDITTEEKSRGRGDSIKRSRGALRGSTSMSISKSESMELDPSGVGLESGSGSGLGGPRRRSARLDKSASGLLGTFPNVGMDTSTITNSGGGRDESYMSLNTTISNPSQFPPTADRSSLLNLPRWSIPLSKLTPLPLLLQSHRSKGDGNADNININIHTIVCILSVDQPVLRKRKDEKLKGREGTLWIGNWSVTAPPPPLGTGEVGSCAVKLWDKVAAEWGDERIRKGDVVLLENVSFKPASYTHAPRQAQGQGVVPGSDSPQITISDQSRPRITILYRTLPRYYSPENDYVYARPDRPGEGGGDGGGKVVPEDRLLRPDLRLARSDPGVRKVGEIVRWFAGFVGGHVP